VVTEQLGAEHVEAHAADGERVVVEGFEVERGALAGADVIA
jgi:hypothetical protein